MTRLNPAICRPGATLGCVFLGAVVAASIAAGPARAQSTEGKDVYRDANCVGCHKWYGGGGGGYGGAALSLRETTLDRDLLVEVVRCGRPETRMPYHARRAWTDANPCYGSTKKEMADLTPPRAATLLRDSDIEAVVDYVITEIQGRGEPTKEECVAFWGSDARECDRF